jgi:hypothetical protein
LHHTVKGASLYQADLGKASKSTIERNQMSTKTTLKRIALVAVSALGFGILSSVAPASATGLMELPTSIAIGTKDSHRTTDFASTNIVLNLPSTAASGDTVVVSARILSCPATSTLCSVTANPTQSAFTGVTNASGASLKWAVGPTAASGSFGTLGNQQYSTSGNATASAVYTINAYDSAGQITLRAQFKPDVSGTYSIGVSTPNAISDVTGDADSATGYYTYSASDTATSYSVTTTGAATSATLTQLTTGAGSGSSLKGTLFKLSLSDGTNSTILGSSESITLSSNDTSVSFATPGGDVNTATTSLVLTGAASGYLLGGSYYFRVDNSATTSESVTITATGSGTLSSSVTTNAGIAFTARTSTQVAYDSVDGTQAGDDTSAVATSGSTATARDYTVAAGDSSHSLRATITTQAAIKTAWVCDDTSGKITGFPGADFSRVITHTAADTYAYVDITISASLLVVGGTGQSFTCTLDASTDRSITFTAATTAASTLTVTNSSRRVATGSTNSFTVELTDDYDNVMSNKTIVVTVAGRNGATASSSLVTNADGQVTYSLADTGTVGTSDTITFTHTPSSGSAVTASATLTYGTTTVTTLSVYTAPHVAAGVADTNIIYSDKKDIDASSKAGASATTQTVTVLAKDANAVVMSGVAVTFTIAGTGCGLLSTQGTVYTGADGYASTSIYAWYEGKCTVTAVAGGQTVTTDAYFVQKGASEARTITAAVSGGMVTATVKDRFGNPIKGVYVYATRTGEGYFGNGASSTSGTTGEAGTVEFYLIGNTSATTVKVQLGDSSAASDEFGQSSADAGKYGTKSATQTAFTAYTAGTTTTAETGVGATLSPAGVNSATVTVAAASNAARDAAEAAADAAAEAIDAANAATDAANLAAEAADAATVAAEEARDAARDAAEAATDAAAEAIDAANAATEAANLAAEGADAATVAAEEARDAADAATAAVEELATQVATLMAALKAQITTLANTVAKIAKKVKA